MDNIDNNNINNPQDGAEAEVPALSTSIKEDTTQQTPPQKEKQTKVKYVNFLNSPRYVNWRDYSGSDDSSSSGEEEEKDYKPIARKKSFVEQVGKNPQNGSSPSFQELAEKQGDKALSL